MKIKVVLNQENRGDPDMPKKEVVEDEGAERACNEWPEPGEEDATHQEPNEENLSLANIPNSTPSPLNSYPQHLVFFFSFLFVGFSVYISSGCVDLLNLWRIWFGFVRERGRGSLRR